MKKIIEEFPSYKFEHLTKFYYEDINVIIAIFESYNFKVNINDSDYEYSSIDDIIINKGTKIKSLIFEAKNNKSKVKISFSKWSVYITQYYSDNNESKINSLITDLLKHFESKRSLFLEVISKLPVFIFVVFILNFINFILLVIILKHKLDHLYYLMALNYILLVTFLIFSITSTRVKLTLEKRNIDNFYKRNKDKIIWSLITYGLGFLSAMSKDIYNLINSLF